MASGRPSLVPVVATPAKKIEPSPEPEPLPVSSPEPLPVSSPEATTIPQSQLRSRRTTTYPPEREFIQPISLDSIHSPREDSPRGSPVGSPRGRAVGDEPAVEIEDEEVEITSPIPKVVTPHPFPEVDEEVVPEPIPVPVPTPIPRPSPQPLPSKPKPPIIDDEDGDEDDLTEEEERMMIIARLKIMKRGWPEIDVGDYDTKTISLKRLRKVYKIFKCRVVAEDISGGYKKWLIAGFVLLELIFVRVFKLDMSGLVVNQIQMMSSYSELLLELAEKYGSTYKSYFPVEVRLMFAMGVNAGIFFILKNFLGDANSDMAKGIASALNGGKDDSGGMGGMISGVMNMLTGGAPKPSGESLQPPTARRRRRKEEGDPVAEGLNAIGMAGIKAGI